VPRIFAISTANIMAMSGGPRRPSLPSSRQKVIPAGNLLGDTEPGSVQPDVRRAAARYDDEIKARGSSNSKQDQPLGRRCQSFTEDI